LRAGSIPGSSTEKMLVRAISLGQLLFFVNSGWFSFYVGFTKAV
jgi:hypothetical protein